MYKKSLLLFALFAPLAANAGPAKFTFAVPKECKFTLPPEWKAQRMQFLGECKAGKIEGDGILKFYAKKGMKVEKSIVGHFGFGKPISGVIITETGYRPFSFEDGKFVDSDDRNAIIEQFDIAAKAAKSVASRYKGVKNANSAKFYDNIAQKLQSQMD